MCNSDDPAASSSEAGCCFVFLMIIIIILGARTSCDTAPKGVRSISLAPRGAQGAFFSLPFQPKASSDLQPPLLRPPRPHTLHTHSHDV